MGFRICTCDTFQCVEDERFDGAAGSVGEFEREFDLVPVVGGELVQDADGVDDLLGFVFAFGDGRGEEVATVSFVDPGTDLGQVDLGAFAIGVPVFDAGVDFGFEFDGDGCVEGEEAILDAFAFGVSDLAT